MSHLTPSQAKIATLAAMGRSNKEIAQTLEVSPHTVKNHLSQAYYRTGTHSRTELAYHLFIRKAQ